MNHSVLGCIFESQNELMSHLAYYGILTDEQIFEMSSNDLGIDVNYALQLMVERDFCKGAIDNVITELHKLGESNKIL